jgi:hypothetical protein
VEVSARTVQRAVEERRREVHEEGADRRCGGEGLPAGGSAESLAAALREALPQPAR